MRRRPSTCRLTVSRPVPSLGVNSVTTTPYLRRWVRVRSPSRSLPEGGFPNGVYRRHRLHQRHVAGLNGCFLPDGGISSDSPTTTTGGGAVTYTVMNSGDTAQVAYYGFYDAAGGTVCIGTNGSPLYGFNPSFGVGGMAKKKGGNGDLSITAKDVTSMPLRPRAGDNVVFRVNVSNLGATSVTKVAIALMVDSKETGGSAWWCPAIQGGKYRARGVRVEGRVRTPGEFRRRSR